jgi:hypothetical protein
MQSVGLPAEILWNSRRDLYETLKANPNIIESLERLLNRTPSLDAIWPSEAVELSDSQRAFLLRVLRDERVPPECIEEHSVRRGERWYVLPGTRLPKALISRLLGSAHVDGVPSRRRPSSSREPGLNNARRRALRARLTRDYPTLIQARSLAASAGLASMMYTGGVAPQRLWDRCLQNLDVDNLDRLLALARVDHPDEPAYWGWLVDPAPHPLLEVGEIDWDTLEPRLLLEILLHGYPTLDDVYLLAEEARVDPRPVIEAPEAVVAIARLIEAAASTQSMRALLAAARRDPALTHLQKEFALLDADPTSTPSPGHAR